MRKNATRASYVIRSCAAWLKSDWEQNSASGSLLEGSNKESPWGPGGLGLRMIAFERFWRSWTHKQGALQVLTCGGLEPIQKFPAAGRDVLELGNSKTAGKPSSGWRACAREGSANSAQW